MLQRKSLRNPLFLALTLPVFLVGACSADSNKSDKESSTQNTSNQDVSNVAQSVVQPSTVLQPEVIAEVEAAEAITQTSNISETTASEPEEAPKAVPQLAPVTAAAKKSDNWAVNKEASKLTFAGTQTGSRFEGQFDKFDASIKLDPDNLDDAKIEILVDMASAKTGDKQRDSSLPAEEWFNIKEHPTALYTSTKIVSVGEGAYEASGTLKIRNIEKKILLPFTLSIEGDRAMAKGNITIVRTGFEVGQGQWATDEWVGVAVDIGYEIDANRN